MEAEVGIIRALLAADAQTYQEAMRRGLVGDLFITNRKPWEFLENFRREYGSLPPREEVARFYPDLFTATGELASVEYYLDDLKKRRLYNRVRPAILKATDSLKERDSRGALRLLQTLVLESQEDVRSRLDTNLTQNVEFRLEEYRRIKTLGGLDGLPTPWPKLNGATRGFHGGELIVITARPGTGKSWVITLLGGCIHALGKTPLLVSREMGDEQFMRRIDATNARVSYTGLRGGNLSSEQESRFETMLLSLPSMAPFWISADDEAMGVLGLSAKIDSIRPDIVIVDGMYLMQDDRGETGWEGIANLTRDLKKLAVSKQIPIIVTTQLNRGAKGLRAGLDNLAFGDSIGMNADLVIGLLQTDQMREERELIVRILKQREGVSLEFKIVWDLELMNFEEKSEDGDAPSTDDDTDDFDQSAVLGVR